MREFGEVGALEEGREGKGLKLGKGKDKDVKSVSFGWCAPQMGGLGVLY